MTTLDAQVSYLLCFPDPVEKSGDPPEHIRGLKDAPYFQPVDIAVRTLEQANMSAGGESVFVTRQRYDDFIQVIEARFHLRDVLDPDTIQKRENIENSLLQALVPQKYIENGLFEEYVVLQINCKYNRDVHITWNLKFDN